MSQPSVSEVLSAHSPQPRPGLPTSRQGGWMAAALVALGVVLAHRGADAPALAAWAAALLVIAAALPRLPGIAAAVGLTGIALLTLPMWPPLAAIGPLAFGAGRVLSRLHRLRLKIAARAVGLGLNAAALDHLVARHDHAIALLDGDGRLLAHNRGWCELPGAAAGQMLIGNRWWDFLDEATRATCRDALALALQTGAARSRATLAQRRCAIELRVLTSRDAAALLLCTLRPEPEPEPGTGLATGLLQLASAAQARGEGFIACDGDWRVMAANDHARAQAKRGGIAQPLTRPVWELLPWITPTCWREVRLQTGAAPVWRDPALQGAVCRELPDAATQRWYETTFFPWQEGIVVLYRDVSRRRADAARAAMLTARWQLVRRAQQLGEWSFDLERAEFLLCATARGWFGAAPACGRLGKAQLLAQVDENDRLKLVQGIIGAACAPSARLDLEVCLRADGARPPIRLRWLGRLADGSQPAQLVGVLQRMT